jgi:hypothetical protein
MKFGFGKVWSILASLWEGAAKRMIIPFMDPEDEAPKDS